MTPAPFGNGTADERTRSGISHLIPGDGSACFRRADRLWNAAHAEEAEGKGRSIRIWLRGRCNKIPRERANCPFMVDANTTVRKYRNDRDKSIFRNAGSIRFPFVSFSLTKTLSIPSYHCIQNGAPRLTATYSTSMGCGYPSKRSQFHPYSGISCAFRLNGINGPIGS